MSSGSWARAARSRLRRSQSIAYRPACDQCRACVSVRVVASNCRPTRNLRRVLDRDSDIVGELRTAVPTSEQYSVFRAYLDGRHRNGGMADMTVLDYAMMVEDSHVQTRMIEYRRRTDAKNAARTGDLIGVALTDVLNDGLSMVYSFFEPDEQGRSLGTFMILDHIARARRMGCLRLLRLLDRGLAQNALQEPLPARSGWRRADRFQYSDVPPAPRANRRTDFKKIALSEMRLS